MKKANFTQTIEDELSQLAKKSKPSPFDPAKYIIGQSKSDLRFLNMKVPDVRSVLKNKKIFSSEIESLFPLIQEMWFKSNLYEAKYISLMWLDQQSSEFLISRQKDLVKWATLIDNWAHSDSLSDIFARIYEVDSAYLQKTFLKWNTHKNGWLRRQSMVSLFYYSYSRKKQPSYIVAEKSVFNNLLHSDYYVQKGVGWTLREMHNVYPEKTFKFLEKNIKSISSIAWVAATEKLPSEKKLKLLKKRRT